MKNIWICNRWKMRIAGDSLQDAIEVGGRRVIQHETRIQHLGENAYCLYEALMLMGKVERVLDLCAGIGLWATILMQEKNPRLILVDLDKACCKSLKKRFPGACVVNEDYNKVSYVGQDLVCMDVTISTAMRVFGLPYPIPLLEVLKSEPKWVLISDCAAGKLHLNAKHYKKVLGKAPENYAHYIDLYSQKLEKIVGKGIHTAFMSGKGKLPHSCYFLIGLKDMKPVNIKIIKNIPLTRWGHKEQTLL